MRTKEERKNMSNQVKYWEMWRKYNEGEVTVQEWQLFCETMLVEILTENKDIFTRLKYR